MKNIINKKILYSAFLFFLFFVLVFPVKADLSDAFSVNKGKSFGLFAKNMGYATGDQATTVESFVAIVIEAVLGLLGVIFIIFIFYGGIMWMTAGGGEEKIKKAQTIIKRAVIGLAITLLSYSISYFVIKIFTN